MARLPKERIIIEANEYCYDDDFFTNTVVDTKKPDTFKSEEQEYIKNCFIDLEDSGVLTSTRFLEGQVELTFNLVIFPNDTFSSLLKNSREKLKLVDNIDECLTKLRIKNQHMNVSYEQYDSDLVINIKL